MRLPKGKTSLGYTPSPVSTINGQDAVTFLKKYSLDGRLQDLDALYNANFYSIAQQGTNMDEFEIRTPRYPGESTSFVFANGTQHNYTNIAVVSGSFRGVVDGPSFYNKFCNGKGTLTPKRPPRLTLSAGASTKVAEGYPLDPVIIHSQGTVGGYYLKDAGLQDVAVLSIPSFSPDPQLSRSSGQEFQSVIQNFLVAAKAAGKTKLVVDLQSNGGGLINLGYDAFLQLFPNIQPFGGSVFRAHEGLDFIGQGINDLVKNIGRADPYSVSTEVVQALASSSLNYRVDLTANGTAFNSWKEVYGPQEANGDKFTSIVRLNLSDPKTSLNAFPYIDMTGFGKRANFTQPPFAAENIIMLTDGFCASTCTLFTEFMKTHANVTSFVLGGRPQEGPMQTMGGTRGAQVIPYELIVLELLAIANNGTSATDNPIELQNVSSLS